MKKLLLLSFILIGINTNAQVIYSTDFTTGTGMNIIDNDGDTLNWGLYAGSAASVGWGFTGNFAGSYSWNFTAGALEPDNFLLLPEITLPSSFDTFDLSFKIAASCPTTQTYFAENVSVYLAPSTATVAEIIALTPIYSMTLTEDYRSYAITENIDISSYSGQSFRIVFRHHDCTDQEAVFIDDVTVTQTTLANNEFLASKFSVYPNPANNFVNIAANGLNMNSIELSDLNGRVVKNISVNGSETQVNISDLSQGVYMMKITSDEGVATKKIVKQ